MVSVVVVGAHGWLAKRGQRSGVEGREAQAHRGHEHGEEGPREHGLRGLIGGVGEAVGECSRGGGRL